jgi:Fe-S oxidoreductase
MSLSAPSISNSLRDRKASNISLLLEKKDTITVMTTCPSCVQGLSKISSKNSVKGKAMAVYLAEIFLGKGWKKDFISNIVKKDGIERIIL